MDSSPKSAKIRVSGVISPEYSQSPMVSRKIASKSAAIWSRSPSAMSGPFTQRACDDKIAVTHGIHGQRSPCQQREFPGQLAAYGDFNDRPGALDGLDDDTVRTMNQAAAKRLAHSLFRTPEPGQPLCRGGIP